MRLVGSTLIEMEEEDFGFTKRTGKVLRNALVSDAADVKKPYVTGEQVGGAGTGALYRDGTGKLNDDENTAAAPQPDTGSGDTESESMPKGKINMGESLVVDEPPSIPNVVEYHLKVKTSRSSETVSKNTSASSESDAKSLPEEFNTKMAVENKGFETQPPELPQTFHVKYLGSHDARGLWGIKHTRRPVDNMVSAARSLPAGTILPLIKLVVSKDGVDLLPLGKKRHDVGISKRFTIDTISYGVQDLVYTRVFSMIVVREGGQTQRISPFECHGFVCESRHHARQLTYALAHAFQIYSINVKAQGKAEETAGNIKKRFAIDLRTPEEIEADLTIDSEA